MRLLLAAGHADAMPVFRRRLEEARSATHAPAAIRRELAVLLESPAGRAELARPAGGEERRVAAEAADLLARGR